MGEGGGLLKSERKRKRKANTDFVFFLGEIVVCFSWGGGGGYRPVKMYIDSKVTQMQTIVEFREGDGGMRGENHPEKRMVGAEEINRERREGRRERRR